jgi:hypothetical protein
VSVSLIAAPDMTIPLELTIEQEGVGGVIGQVPSVRVRDGSTLNSFLDWDDNTFKTALWTEKDRILDEVEDGHYTTLLNLATIGAIVGNIFVAQYVVNDGGDIIGDAHDVILVGQQALTAVSQLLSEVSLIRKSVTNRMEESPGNPGVLIVFDDDDSTAILQFLLRDALGNGIASPALSPARRSKSII